MFQRARWLNTHTLETWHLDIPQKWRHISSSYTFGRIIMLCLNCKIFPGPEIWWARFFRLIKNNRFYKKGQIFSGPLYVLKIVHLCTFCAGDRYIVADCGGGTVDLTVHQIEQPQGTLKELYKASGTHVHKLLQHAVQNPLLHIQTYQRGCSFQCIEKSSCDCLKPKCPRLCSGLVF